MSVDLSILKKYEAQAKDVYFQTQDIMRFGSSDAWIPIAWALHHANQPDWTDKSAWMETFTGKRFYPLNPNSEDIEIVDIAQALSMLCRYNGHCINFYCPTPEHRVLTADLQWKHAGDIKVGQELLSFDEYPVELGTAGNKRRKQRHAFVTYTQSVKRECIRLILEDGSEVTTSDEHPWLVATKQSRNQKWQTAVEIKKAVDDGRVRYMHKFFEPWNHLSSREAGWLSGLFDGEGSLSGENHGGSQLQISQKEGVVLDTLKNLLKKFGFEYNEWKNPETSVVQIQISGTYNDRYRLLGQLQPLRLLNKFTSGIRSGKIVKQLDGHGTPLQIVAAETIGERWVAGMETSSHTYFCEGFGAHNCVAEHSIHLSDYVLENLLQTDQYDTTTLAKIALLHDATEAYLADVVRPVKPHLSNYGEIEHNLYSKIAAKFGIPETIPSIIKDIDTRICLDERAGNMFPSGHTWEISGEPLGISMQFMTPALARATFMTRFHDLFRV